MASMASGMICAGIIFVSSTGNIGNIGKVNCIGSRETSVTRAKQHTATESSATGAAQQTHDAPAQQRPLPQVNVALLKRLSETPGVAGREERIRELVISELRPLVDELQVDALGNVTAIKRGSGNRRVMLAAHMDEIGFMVRHIDDDGFL